MNASDLGSAFRTYCVYTETKEMSPSALDRYNLLMNQTNDVETGGAEAWKELAKLNVNLNFDIGRSNFPQRASDTLLKMAGGTVSNPFEVSGEIIRWLQNHAPKTHPSAVPLASLSLPASFGKDVKNFFLNMQSLLKDGHLERQEPPEFWPWFIAVLQSIETHAGGGAHHVPTPAAASAHPLITTPAHVNGNIPPHAIR